jgi:ribosomal protein S18 acetylase RimI-like enzyme
MRHLLDNIVWHTLNGPHAKFATGTADVRRYAPGYSPIIGFADPRRPNFTALAPFCEPGLHLYCDRWPGPVPEGWRVDGETTLCKMVWEAPVPLADPAPDAVRLGPEYAALALDLVTLTRPGPYGPRTIELGEYWGCFDGGRLVAMAGERLYAGTLHEISGVCTHPDYQGRGMARGLMTKLILRQMQRGETPFLHVMRDNEHAHRLYERMGFRDHAEAVVRVVART